MKSLILLFILLVNIYSYSQENMLKAVALNYIVRTVGDGYNLDFNNQLKISNSDMEFSSGNQWEAFQPVGIFQNVSDKMLTFSARMEIYNVDKKKKIYLKNVKVSHECLLVGNSKEQSCEVNPFIKVSYVDVDYKDNYYNVKYLPYPGDANLKGIPPGGYAEVIFSPFEPNSFLPNHIGNCSISLYVIPISPESGDTLNEKYFVDDTLKFALNLREMDCSEIYYPNDGDTIQNGKNYFYGMGHQKSSVVFTTEYSKTEDFKKIEISLKGYEKFDVKFPDVGRYYWRLLGKRQDTICYSDQRTFYVKDVNSIDDINLQNLVFPNPAKDFITIQLSEGTMIEIFDVMGIKQLSEQINEINELSLQKIDISHLMQGVYFIKIGNRIERFIKL